MSLTEKDHEPEDIFRIVFDKGSRAGRQCRDAGGQPMRLCHCPDRVERFLQKWRKNKSWNLNKVIKY